MAEIASAITLIGVHGRTPPFRYELGWLALGSFGAMHLYSLVRRIPPLRRGVRSLEPWLDFHVFLGLQGFVFAGYHSVAIDFASGIATGAAIVVILLTASGVFGRYLMPSVRAVQTHAIWSVIHRPLAFVLAALLVLHVLAHYAYADSGDVTALVAADSYVAASPGFEGADAADIAWAAHITWRGQRRGATIDYVQRESLIGGAARRELHELAYTDRSFEPMTFTVGRYRVPGGYWLFADGVQIGYELTDSLEVAIYGGARSFSNARSEQLLTTDPHFLPLIGAALTRKGDVQARVSYTLTRDRVVLPRGDGMTSESELPEQFLDAELFALVNERVQITAGATMGTRYLVTYPTVTAELTDDPRLDTQYFGAQSAYGLADVKLSPQWRVAGGLTAHRTKLGQLTDTPAAQSITGSFLEASGRATWRRAKAWRVAVRARSRVWADARQAYRVYGQAQYRRGVLDVQASAGADIRVGADEPMYDNRTTFLYRASVGRKTKALEFAGGVAAVSAIGDELAATPGDDTGSTRAPYTLEARTYAFGRGFWTHDAWFAGADVEVDLYGNGARALLQVGWAR